MFFYLNWNVFRVIRACKGTYLTSDIFQICNFLKKMPHANILKHTKNTNNSGVRFYKQIYNE